MNYHILKTRSIPLKLLRAINRDCGATGFTIYSILLCHAKTNGPDKGKAFPSQELLAKESTCSLRTITSCLKRLEEYRYIAILKQRSKAGYDSNIYWIPWIKKRNSKWTKNELKNLLTNQK